MAEYDFGVIGEALKSLRHLSCSACGTDPPVWGGGDAVISLPVTDKQTQNGHRFDEPKPVDVVCIACDHCGHTKFFQLSILLARWDGGSTEE